MGMERRGCVDQLYLVVNQQWEEPLRKAKPCYCGRSIGARMSREVHVRICEGVGVRFPYVTRPLYPSIFFFHPKFYCYLAHFHAKGDLSTWLFAFSPGSPLPGCAGLGFIIGGLLGRICSKGVVCQESGKICFLRESRCYHAADEGIRLYESETFWGIFPGQKRNPKNTFLDRRQIQGRCMYLREEKKCS